jgi:hypothetical protein
MIFKTSLLTAITLVLFTAPPLATALPADKDNAANAPVTLNYRTANVDGVEVFYREAGPKTAPALLLLHDFPTSSNMFRNLIPLLADKYHVMDYGALIGFRLASNNPEKVTALIVQNVMLLK